MHQKTTLDNGLRIITETMPHTRSVSICVFIGVGSRYETGRQAGASHFIEHLMFKGTPRRTTAKEISMAIEGVGGIINAGTDKELTVYWCKAAQPHFPLALDVLSDIMLHSKFDPDDIENERRVITEEIHMEKDSPSQLVNLLIDQLLWPEHPLGRDVAGDEETVAGINREMMLDYLGRQYLPGNSVVSIAGAGKHRQMVSAVKRGLGGWPDRKPRSGYEKYEEKSFPKLKIECKETEQAHLCLGWSPRRPDRGG